jgi:hypothetical protein
MVSWDVWDTLITRRLQRDVRLDNPGLEPAEVLQREIAQCYPIVENVARVQPDDILISDYDCLGVVPELVRQITGLQNQVIVTNEDKRNGSIWSQLPQRPTLHVGDNRDTDGTCVAAGIPFECTSLKAETPPEEFFRQQGFPGLSNWMREARLTSHCPAQSLEFFQIQANLPVLFLGSIVLHKKLESDNYKQVLMSSRDCFLWTKLLEALQQHWHGHYAVTYFWTSRHARNILSANYRQYVDALMKTKSLIVDLCGTGATMRKIARPEAVWYLTGHKMCGVPRYIEAGMHEPTNWARHAMVADVDEKGQPIFTNPLNIDWENLPEVKTMHNAFMHALSLISQQDFTKDFNHDSGILPTFKQAVGDMDKYKGPVHALDELSNAGG